MLLIVEAFITLLATYICLGISVYAFSVLKTYEFTTAWIYKFENGYIGMFKSPKWLLWWLEKIPFLVEGSK